MPVIPGPTDRETIEKAAYLLVQREINLATAITQLAAFKPVPDPTRAAQPTNANLLALLLSGSYSITDVLKGFGL